MRLDENVTLARENVSQKDTAARSGQESSVIVIEDSVALVLEAAAGAMFVDVRSRQIRVTSEVSG